MKLNQSEYVMSLQVVIQVLGNPGSNTEVTLKFTLLVLLPLIVNVPFCHEVGDKESDLHLWTISPGLSTICQAVSSPCDNICCNEVSCGNSTFVSRYSLTFCNSKLF